MELPKTIRPSPLKPTYLKGYVFAIFFSLILATILLFSTPYLTFLPFPPVYLHVLDLLPLYKLIQTEIRRRSRSYEFQTDRVLIREGMETVEQEDVPYSKITDVSSVTPFIEKLLGVGDLELHIAGADEDIRIIGVRHPQQYEDLMLGKRTSTTGDTSRIQQTRNRLEQLENDYNQGQIGRAEYERDYYYYKGQLDLLEEQQSSP